jgi:hypothetical protein
MGNRRLSDFPISDMQYPIESNEPTAADKDSYHLLMTTIYSIVVDSASGGYYMQ